MRLYLVQHAKAVSKEVDSKRPLTEHGLREIRKVAAFIKPLNLCVDYLWHSGKKRAAQTAEVLAEVISIKKIQTERDGLGPADDVNALVKELTSNTGDIMIVGHLPFLNKLSSLILTGSESAGAIAFRNAGIVCLGRSEENQWQVEWIIVPEVLA
jgi:phosphohistidine phosphatase